MSNDNLRRQIAFEAARLLWSRDEREFFRARRRAAQRLGGEDGIRQRDLPTRREIHEQVLALARADRRELRRQDLGRVAEVVARPAAESPGPAAGWGADRFHQCRALLLPLEHVKENLQTHPEGDVLYHSLQVFELAREQLPYDEEFLLAALLHDVGKAIDAQDHVAAGLEALAGLVTPRTAWLIEHHVEALAVNDGSLGVRARRRLEAGEDFEELMLLARCDRMGRRRGVPAPNVDEALDYLRRLAEMCGP